MKITICGNIGFYKEMESARDELVKNGHEVKIPELAFEPPQKFSGDKKVYFDQYIKQSGGIDAYLSLNCLIGGEKNFSLSRGHTL